MVYPTLAEIREEIVPNDIWTLDNELGIILKRQISLLPSCSNPSKSEYKYPEDKASLRGFLDRLFARNFFKFKMLSYSKILLKGLSLRCNVETLL